MGKPKNNDTERKFRVPEEVKELEETTLKKYKKNYADDFCSKKEIKKDYLRFIVDRIPSAIEFLVRFGHLPDNAETRETLYARITSEEVIALINKYLDKDYEIENIEYLPIIIYDILREDEIQYQKELKENPETAKRIVSDDLVDLAYRLNKKKLKKMEKKGIDKQLAFDCLCILPTPELIGKGRNYRIKQVFQIIYEHAKEKSIDIDTLFKILFKEDKYPSVISFALLERKEKYLNFNDSQKEAFNKISIWAFDKLEDMDKEDIVILLKGYFSSRKRDKQQNKDSARRYFLGTLPEDKYPKITKAINTIKNVDATIEEFL